MEYEICYLVGESKESELERIKEEVGAIISQEGAKLLDPEKVEKRKLAYKVKKEIRGIYVAKHFIVEKDEDSEKNPLEGITRKMNLKNEVLRFMIAKADEVPALIKKEEMRDEPVEKKPARIATQSVAGEEKTREQSEKPKAKQDNIDDQLEEILNI
jgi:ribosomal protein S6